MDGSVKMRKVRDYPLDPQKWATIQRLGTAIAKPPEDVPPATETKKAGKTKAGKRAKPARKVKAAKKAGAGNPREDTHKAEVIAMVQRVLLRSLV